MESLIITPKTKIYDLIEAYPQLEDELIRLAPEFKKLKNPLLRKTIAKVATLAQAAIVGGLNVETLVNQMRTLAGQHSIEEIEDPQNKYQTDRPEWFSEELVHASLDIKAMLNRGEQPVHEVLSAIKQLQNKQILHVIAPFVPAPLIDKSLSLNYRHWIKQNGPEDFSVYFTLP